MDKSVAGTLETALLTYVSVAYPSLANSDLISSSVIGGGGTTEPTEPDTPTGKSSITGNTNLKCSYSRTYTGKFFDANDNEVTNVIGTWTITSTGLNPLSFVGFAYEHFICYHKNA